jgi:hypothetical protein
VNETIIADNPRLVLGYQLLALKGSLKLESMGMRRTGPSALSQVKAMGIKARTAKQALPLFVALLKKEGFIK